MQPHSARAAAVKHAFFITCKGCLGWENETNYFRQEGERSAQVFDNLVWDVIVNLCIYCRDLFLNTVVLK